MKAQHIKKYLSRSIVAIFSAALVTSCAYENGYNNAYGSTSPRNHSSNDPTVPLLIGAAAIGAIALAKRHKDKKKHRHYDHHRNHHYNHHRGHYNRRGYGHYNRRTCPQRRYERGYSYHRGYNELSSEPLKM